MQSIATVATFAAVYVAMDAVWLAVARNMYATNVARIQGSPLSVRWAPAVVCYALIVLAAYILILHDVSVCSYYGVALRATMFALLAYGVYNLTNLATLNGFSLRAALVDTLWGVVVINVSTLMAFMVARRWGRWRQVHGA